MEIHLRLCFSFMVHLAVHISIAGADFSTQPDSQPSTCVGIDLPLDWTINNEASINTVAWSFNGVGFALKVGNGGTPTYTGITASKVEHTTSGKIVIKNPVVADSGKYSCRVVYTVSSIASVSSTATVAVVTAPSDPTLTKTGNTYTCATDSTSVTVTIKVDDVDKGTTTFTVSDDSKVECCLSGYAVQCRDDTSGTEYCKVLQTADTPTPSADGCFSQAGCTAGVVLGSIYGTSWLVAIVVNLVIYCMNQMLLAWNLCDGPMKRLWIWILLFIFLPYIPSVISIYLFRTNRPAKKPTSGMELEKNGTP